MWVLLTVSVISNKLDGHMLQIITRCAAHDAQTGTCWGGEGRGGNEGQEELRSVQFSSGWYSWAWFMLEIPYGG